MRFSVVNQPIQTGTTASFTVGDVVCPDVAQVLRQTGPELAVSGRVVYLSDSGLRKDHFAIIDVGGIHAPVIVPVNRLRVSLRSAGDPGATVASRGVQ